VLNNALEPGLLMTDMWLCVGGCWYRSGSIASENFIWIMYELMLALQLL